MAVAGWLDSLYPICVFFAFLAVLIFDWATLRSPKTEKGRPRGRRTTLTFTLAIFATYVANVGINLVYALQHAHWEIPEHVVVGALGNMFVWGVISAALISTKNPMWDPYIASWLLGLGFEAAICATTALDIEPSAYNFTRVCIQGFRISILLLATLNIFRLPLRQAKKEGSDDEAEPLLSGATTPITTPTTAYGSGDVSKDDDGDSEEEADPDKELKDAQRKRLESHGGWVGYIKEFKIFIPYLIPYKNRKIQLCIAIMVINIILDRFINVMVPRQLGIITDKLAEDYTSMPWKAVLVWVVLKWLNSFASFGLISDIAHTHLHNWSSAQIKQLAFRHVMSLSMDFHSNKDSGEVIKSIGQADSLNELLETIFFDMAPIVLDLIIAFFYVTHLFDGSMALVVAMVGFSFIWINTSSTTYTRPHRRVYTEKSRAESKTLYECVSNWPTISYFNRTKYEEDRYEEAVSAEMSAQMRYYIINSLGYAVQYLIIYAGLTTVSMMAIFQIREGRKPIGNFIVLIMYWSSMMSPLHMITYSYRRLSSATVDAERLLQLLQTEPTVKSKIDAAPLESQKGRVIFDNVGFSYDDRKTTLKDVSFTAEPGHTIALVGETGGGKSTTLKLLFRFYDVSTGSITIDGQDIRDVSLESLRQELGVVPQDPSLFNQTIMENVRYARLDATDAEVIEACKAAAVHEKITSFPDGYKSKVGERGVKLSGGELQRIAIARVILKNPKIVLLDEATSAVDSAIEAQIQAAFKKLSAGRTTFVVAHRLSTIMEANMILVVDHGVVIERGTHQYLLERGGKYHELWTKQTTGKNASADLLVDIDDVTLEQVDGACESKIGSCFGEDKSKKSSIGEAETVVGDVVDEPIQLVPARSTEAGAPTIAVPKVTISEHNQVREAAPRESSSSTSSSSSDEGGTKMTAAEFKSVQGRRPTGYPSQMPGAVESSSSSSSSSSNKEVEAQASAGAPVQPAVEENKSKSSSSSSSSEENFQSAFQTRANTQRNME